MSVAYEPRSFHDDSPYAPVGENDHDHTDLGLNKYINTEANVDDMADLAAATYDATGGPPSPFNTSDSPALDLDPVVGPPNVDPTNLPIRESSSEILGANDVGHAHNPSTRSKPIAKPIRMVTKNEDGLYECRWQDCKEEIKSFHRKCEWSKHMDKHERPYVCTVKGCEKVQGFTYSGGLLRHEREVHGKHGGPKKALNCPHASCKRNKGKGFSRLENLQEHLRRVHRDASEGAQPPSTPVAGGGDGGGGDGGGPHDDDSASDVASAAFARVMCGTTLGSPSLTTRIMLTELYRNTKRKRRNDDEDEDDDGEERQRARAEMKEHTLLREENERLRVENGDLRRQLAEQTRLANEMRTQLQSMQAAISQTLAVPQPPVL